MAKRRVDIEKLIELWPSRLPTKSLEQTMGHDHQVLYKAATRIGLKHRMHYWANGIEKVDRGCLNIPAESFKEFLEKETA